MKWAKEKGGQPLPLPQLPQLAVTDHEGTPKVATTFPEKVAMLRTQFFPEPRDADLSDINNALYLEPIKILNIISQDEIQQALRWVAKDKAPGPD